MKKNYLSASVALLLAVTGCQNEEVINQSQGREFRVEVSVGGGSRTDIGENGYMTWSEGDQIYVGNLAETAGGVLTLVSGAGSHNAVFAGIVTGSGNLEYSVFPVPNANGEIDLTTRKAGQSNAPLISTFNPSNPGELSFEKTCGVVRIEVSGEKGGELTLNTEEAANQQHLGGVAEVVFNPITNKFELQYTRGTGGVTITDLPEDGTIDVPVITEAVKEDGTADNLNEDIEHTFVVKVNDKEIEFEAEVETGAVTANDVPRVDVEDDGELIAYTSVANQTELMEALKAGVSNIYLAEGNYELTKPSLVAESVNIAGADRNKCIVKITGQIRAKDGVTSLTLKNLTTDVPTGLKYDEDNFAWIHYLKNFSMINCNSNGRIRLNVHNAIINGCVFNVTTKNGFDGYAIHYQGATNSNVSVEYSQFYTAGKAIVLYNEGTPILNLDVTGCTFESSDKTTDKAAIQMHTELGISGTVDIVNSTATGFANVNDGLWNEINNNTQAVTYKFNITVDGKNVHSAK